MSHQPEMMKPRCVFCEQDFTPGRHAVIAAQAWLHEEATGQHKEIRINLCDGCALKVQEQMRIFKKRLAAQMN